MRVIILATMVVGLSACNSTLSTLSTGSTTGSSGSTSTSTSSGSGSSGGSTTISSIGQSGSSGTLLDRAPDPSAFDDLLIAARAAVSLNPLSTETRLTKAAQGHAEDMSENNYFSHTDLSGGSVSDRVDATGYDWCWVGENIAYGYTSQASVFDGWMNSPGHRANMLNTNPTEYGLGHDPDGNYWVMVLATPGC